MKAVVRWLMPLWCMALMQVTTGCIFFGSGPDDDVETCEASSVCMANSPDVCGEDGEVYACAEQAMCEAVGIDDTGGSCGEEFCGNRPPAACNLFCVNGFRRDANGCQVCECDVPIVCPSRPSCGGGADPEISGYDDDGCPRYYCPSS